MSEAFDWDILHKPSAMAMVRGQLGFSWMVLSGRLAQLTDEQYFWRPSSEALTVVRRHYAGHFRSLGSGEWVAQWPDEPDHRGPRTIAWLIAQGVASTLNFVGMRYLVFPARPATEEVPGD